MSTSSLIFVFDCHNVLVQMPSLEIHEQILFRPNNFGISGFGVSLLFFKNIITVVYLVNEQAAPTITAAFTEPSYLTLPHQQCPPLALVPWSPGRKILRSQTQNWYHCWGLPAANSPYVTHMSWGGFVNAHTRIPLPPSLLCCSLPHTETNSSPVAVVFVLVVAPQGCHSAQTDGIGKEDLGASIYPHL